MRASVVLLFLLVFAAVSISYSQYDPGLQRLAAEYFERRALSAPITGDDVPRIERHHGWTPDYSPAAIKRYRQEYKKFSQALRALPHDTWTRHDSVDYLLLRSAIERMNWELNVLDLPGRHPQFYVQQTVGSVFDLLIIGSPWTRERMDDLLVRLRSIPSTVAAAKENLKHPIAPFAHGAIRSLHGIRQKLYAMGAALRSAYPSLWESAMDPAIDSAATALESYSAWLIGRLPSMTDRFSVGRKGFEYFLKNIALVPCTPEELLAMGRQEWDRSVAAEMFETLKNHGLPPLMIARSRDEEIARARSAEEAIRAFIVTNGIISVPSGTPHYVLRATPEYLVPLEDFGELDDFSSPTRIGEEGIRYIPEPSDHLPYFLRSAALDPRPLCIHEGTPGHFFQLVRSWQNPDPIRRHYFDSNANEGIGFYVEEMLMQCGIVDDSPRTREIFASYMRLRALRVEVDINLALGNYTIPQAADYLRSAVPMDSASATGGASFYASTPGQAITYQIGKLQILHLITDARTALGPSFDLLHYHDYMMENGNMPIALQRWEYTGLGDEVRKLW